MSNAIIWDVDGTLVDTAELHFQAWIELARQLKKPFSRADFTATFGRRNPEIIHQLFGQQFSDSEVADLGNRKEDLYRAEAGKGVELLPERGPCCTACTRRDSSRPSAPARRGRTST